MNVIKCNVGHYYDGDKYPNCPHCCKNSQEKIQYASSPSFEQGSKKMKTTVSSEKDSSLTEIVGRSKETDFDDDERTVLLCMTNKRAEPVVGWLVCIKGESFGESYPLRGNKNYIGCLANSNVIIRQDNDVFEEQYGVIIYDNYRRTFIAQPRETRESYYINGKTVINDVQLQAYDILDMGNARLIFMPLCSEKFCWEDI
ncbi:MAG: hypothetical protein PUD20_04130 [bacterium]|nr:hypothetical protein [bacterium]